MFGYETLPCQLPVFCLLLFGQRMQFALFMRYLTVLMVLEQPEITAVCQALCLLGHRCPTALKELEIVPLADTERRCQDLFGLLVGDYLGFLRVTLFLAAVPTLLLFWGRSTGHSVASMTTT